MLIPPGLYTTIITHQINYFNGNYLFENKKPLIFINSFCDV